MAKEIKLPFSELKGTLDDTPIEPTLEITENGVYNVKGYVYADVNVEGGGGSSDFSTAKVAFINNSSSTDFIVNAPFIFEDSLLTDILGEDMSADFPLDIVLYKDQLSVTLPDAGIVIDSVTGDITIKNPSKVTITGAGSITIKDADA